MGKHKKSHEKFVPELRYKILENLIQRYSFYEVYSAVTGVAVEKLKAIRKEQLIEQLHILLEQTAIKGVFVKLADTKREILSEPIELWETLATRSIIPETWLASDTRLFVGRCPVCKGVGQEYYLTEDDNANRFTDNCWVQCSGCKGSCIESVRYTTPSSLAAILYFASDPRLTSQIEQLLQEYRSSIGIWLPKEQNHYPRPIVWMQIPTKHWPLTFAELKPLIDVLYLTLYYGGRNQEARKLQSQLGQQKQKDTLVEISKAWNLASESRLKIVHTDETHSTHGQPLSQYKNPIDPLLAISDKGFGLSSTMEILWFIS